MHFFARTNVGRVRKVNQDRAYASGDPVGNLSNLFIVADGMGGHKAGDQASAIAVEEVCRSVENDTQTNPIIILKNAVKRANKKIFDKSNSDPHLKGMGTTIVAATIDGEGNLVTLNIGDSRLYIINKDIVQVTTDHSLVEEMVKMGKIGREEARNHPDKNIITRALGTSGNIEPDIFESELKKNDIVFLCSDGLSNMVPDEDIKLITKSYSDAGQIADKLIKVANENGGKDNIAVVVIGPLQSVEVTK